MPTRSTSNERLIIKTMVNFMSKLKRERKPKPYLVSGEISFQIVGNAYADYPLDKVVAVISDREFGVSHVKAEATNDGHGARTYVTATMLPLKGQT